MREFLFICHFSAHLPRKKHKFEDSKYFHHVMEKDINRIKVVLAEKKKSNKWLAEQLGVAPTTVSKWCTNSCQPTMETYIKIAKVLDTELSNLVRMND